MEAELRKFMAAQGISGRMPSCTELREAGAFTLYSAISKHGGVGAFAKQLGCGHASKCKSRTSGLCTMCPHV